MIMTINNNDNGKNYEILVHILIQIITIIVIQVILRNQF